MVTILLSFRRCRMWPKHTLAALVAAAVSTGCAVGPDYVRPEVAVPRQYLGQSALDAPQATTSATLVTWWAGFGDPLMTRFVTLALEQDLDLAQASARVAQARAGLGAANAAMLPSGTL